MDGGHFPAGPTCRLMNPLATSLHQLDATDVQMPLLSQFQWRSLRSGALMSFYDISKVATFTFNSSLVASDCPMFLQVLRLPANRCGMPWLKASLPMRTWLATKGVVTTNAAAVVTTIKPTVSFVSRNSIAPAKPGMKWQSHFPLQGLILLVVLLQLEWR